METNLHLPLDHEQWTEYRALKRAVGPEKAAYMTLRLFVELGYQAQAGRPLGVLDEKAQILIGEGIGQEGAPGGTPATATGTATLPGPLRFVLEAGFLAKREDGLYCERFARLNGHLDPTFRSREMWGAEVSKYVRNMRKYEERSMQFALQIPESVWVKEDGGQMAHDEIGQVMMLIRGCDNALGKPERPQNDRGFSCTLARCALAVVKEFTPDQRDAILKKLLSARGNPAIPPTTEQLLARGANGKSRFSELAPILMKGK
jgi:hypothetical protein